MNFVELIGSDHIDDATAAAVSEISQTKDGALKVKMHNKQGALMTLLWHLTAPLQAPAGEEEELPQGRPPARGDDWDGRLQ